METGEDNQLSQNAKNYLSSEIFNINVEMLELDVIQMILGGYRMMAVLQHYVKTPTR